MRMAIRLNIKSVMELKLGVYRHFKGKEYEVIGVAKHSETLENFAVYRALYGEGRLWVRPIEIFTEEIEKDGYKGLRFVWVREKA